MNVVEAMLDDSRQIERVRRRGFFARLKGWLGLGRGSNDRSVEGVTAENR